MRDSVRISGWLLLGLIGFVLLLWSYPRAFPLLPTEVSVRGSEAVELARRAFDELGGIPDEADLQVRLQLDDALERRLLRDLSGRQLEVLKQHPLGRRLSTWRVFATYGSAVYMARVDLSGQVLSIRQRPGRRSTPEFDREAAKDKARQYLRSQGVDLGGYEEPFVFEDRDGGREVRFRLYELPVDLDGVGYGLVVYFEGNERSGWGYWLTDTTSAGNAEEARGWRNFGRVRFVASALLFLVLATLFYRFYDAGKLRLRRALQVAAFVGGAGALWLASFIAHRGPAQDVLIWWVLLGSLFVVLVAFLAFLVAGVGEALARRGWRQRLAAFEALFRGHWRNATVARSMLHGLTLGTFGAGLAVAATLPMRWFGITPSGGQVLASAFRNGVPGVGTLLHDLVIFQVPQFLALLVAVPFLCRRFGMRIGGALSLPVVALMVAPPFQPVPAAESLPWLLAVTAIPLGLFLWSDLLSALLAALVMRMLVVAFPLLLAKDPWLLAGGVVALGAVLIPPSAALFYLFSNRSFTYRFDPMGDVPTEVLERVAERERQRFELETARVVHDAILPELPERCRGVEIAHAYQAATEIGGDFYDVLPLADERRVAVALGDVAGHGVASGLVMSALRGALQVHVRFEPRVTQVFENLNRLLTDGAQRKLLTTLAYGVLDPESGRFVYASAGHPLYVVRADGSLVDLAPRSYPLGVRRHLRIGTSEVELGPGDALFLFSDGLLESCAGNGDEPFGYNRLEESLRRYAGGSAQDLLAGVLQEVADFAGAGSPDDDVTLLVLRLE